MKAALAGAWLLLTILSAQAQDDEVALFDGEGRAIAYIAVADELTVYLWEGKPAAYLTEDGGSGYQVYGFNGKHLGWFSRGVIWDHSGGAACATKDVLATTQLEPYKGYKQYKPYKSYKEYAPYQPTFSNSFGDIPCAFLLASGE